MVLQTVQRAYHIIKDEGVRQLFYSAKETVFLHPHLAERRFRYHTMKNEIYNHLMYDAPAESTALRSIPARDVIYQTTGVPHIDYIGLGHILDGDWDHSSNLEPVDEHWVIKGMEERFNENRDWKNTTYYEAVKKRMSDPTRDDFRGDGTMEEFLHGRCQYLDKLYTSIKTNGYQPASKDINNTNKRYRSHYKDWLEILVAIGRDGTFYLHKGGFHRFGIARILNIDVPVQVACRHKQWQEIRDSYSGKKLETVSTNPEIIDTVGQHPDLEDISPTTNNMK